MRPKMRTLFILFNLLLWMVGAGAESIQEREALFFGKDDRTFVPAPYFYPFSAIGKLEMDSGTRCTATLVANEEGPVSWAVTAAHCFLMIPYKLDKGRWFFVGYHNGVWRARYRVVGLFFLSRFRHGLRYKNKDVYIDSRVRSYDIAWLKLARMEGEAPPIPMPLFRGDQAALSLHS